MRGCGSRPKSAPRAAEIALKRAGVKAREVDHLFFVTVTGIAFRASTLA